MPDSYRIIIKPSAAQDLQQIHEYIEKHSPQNAADVARKILREIDELQQLPHRYPIYEGHLHANEEIRRMVVRPFLVYYHVDDVRKAVHILAIWHGARRQPRRFD